MRDDAGADKRDVAQPGTRARKGYAPGVVRKSGANTTRPLAASTSLIGPLPVRLPPPHWPPWTSSIAGNGPAPCGW